ncbi:MATE family efflux transporter [Clostridium baratii]|uniref:MATE family efflux transporter n=1 Tax=Clostridium baratii TaxID=1561 RepID=UPI001CAE81AE|nr:MATE family efflux transporter [Clostridium baratii]STB00068.1 cation efflux pump [Clostridium baratii]
MENTLKQSNEYYLEKAPIHKAIKRLSIPMMIGMSIGTVYNIINAYFIGQLHNTAALSAITLGLPILTILMAIGNMFGVGGSTYITRLIAKKQYEKAKAIVGYVTISSIVFGIILGVLSFFFMNPLIYLLGANSITFNLTYNYSITLFICGFTMILNFALEQVVRSEGASRESMYGMGISALLNLIFDPLLILYFNLDVVGAALAMSLANLGSAIYYIYFLQYKSEHLKGFIGKFKVSLKDQIEIYKIGVSELLQMSFMIVTTLLLNNYSIEYGDNVVAGFGIALRIVQVPEFLSMGIFLGIMPLLAYNFSNGNFKRLKSGIKQSAIFIGTISLIFVISVYIFRNPIINLFSNDSSVLSIGTYILIAMLISALFNGFTGLLMGVFQASGKAIPTMIMAVAQGILYIPIIIIFHYLFGLHGVIWSSTITEVITFLTGVILYINFNSNLKSNKLNS